MKHLLLRLFVFVILLILVGETAFRSIPAFNDFYQQKTNLYHCLKQEEGAKHCFIGTSRVAAAIVPETMGQHTNCSCFNMGRGYTTGMVHYLGLKAAIRKNPECIKNATVYIESPKGFCAYYHTRNDPWVDAEGACQVVPYLSHSDILEMWRIAGDPFAVKLIVTANYYSRTISYLTFLKELVKRNSIREVLVKIHLIKPWATESNTLTNRGGIKQDEASISNARQFAREYYGDYTNTVPYLNQADWEKSVFNEIRELVEGAGGQLVLFDIPLSSVQLEAYGAQNIQVNAASLKDYCQKYHVQRCSVELNTCDEDFPDLWHISTNKAKEFSELLWHSISKRDT